MSSIAEEMTGKWHSILPTYVDSNFLTGKHGPCPICRAGKDRFRFDNKEGRGTYFCAQCGNGDGFALIMNVTGMTFAEVAKALSPESYEHTAPKKAPDNTPMIENLAKRCKKLQIGDSVSTYLQARGIDALPDGVRIATRLKHYEDGETGHYDAMVARIADSEGQRLGFHVTWLQDCAKAPVKSSRKIYKQAESISGGGIYLGQIHDAAVIGEGIETTLAGMKLTDASGIAAINTTLMQNIKLHDRVQKVAVLSDNDANYAGQKAAYTLANRLVLEGRTVRVIVPDVVGTDFADMLA